MLLLFRTEILARKVADFPRFIFCPARSFDTIEVMVSYITSTRTLRYSYSNWSWGTRVWYLSIRLPHRHHWLPLAELICHHCDHSDGKTSIQDFCTFARSETPSDW